MMKRDSIFERANEIKANSVPRLKKRITKLEEKARLWETRYTELLNWVEFTYDTDYNEIPEELYHITPRCYICRMRHQGSC